MYYYRKEGVKHFKKLNFKDVTLIFISAIICGSLAAFIFMHLLKDNNSFTVNAITSAYPIFTVLFAWILIKEKITIRSIFGAILIVIGAILITKT